MPKDPMMLMSFINMKLRDFYPTLDALCDDMDVDRQELENKMAEAGLEYNAATNKFIPFEDVHFYLAQIKFDFGPQFVETLFEMEHIRALPVIFGIMSPSLFRFQFF